MEPGLAAVVAGLAAGGFPHGHEGWLAGFDTTANELAALVDLGGEGVEEVVAAGLVQAVGIGHHS